jgi:hypothetical protein
MFLKICGGVRLLPPMTRPHRELAVAHRAKLARQNVARDGQPELVPYPPGEIDKAPAHDTVGRRDRPCLDNFGKPHALFIIQDRNAPTGR